MIESGSWVYSSRPRPLFATLNRCKKPVSIYGVAEMEFVRLEDMDQLSEATLGKI